MLSSKKTEEKQRRDKGMESREEKLKALKVACKKLAKSIAKLKEALEQKGAKKHGS